jgi:hypothetical protein
MSSSCGARFVHTPASAAGCGFARARRYRPKFGGRRGPTQAPGQQVPVALGGGDGPTSTPTGPPAAAAHRDAAAQAPRWWCAGAWPCWCSPVVRRA